MKYFDDYVSQFDMNIIPIKYRYNHSYWVMGNIEIIAKSLGLTKYDIELAKCIGLLHDIGRFDQYTEYKNYKDNHLDHGYHGVDIIKRDNALKYFNIDKKDYNVVYVAIINHNKYSIQPGLNKRELLFSKMIRDADKLAILYSLGMTDLKTVFKENKSIISKKIDKDFKKQIIIDESKIKTGNDAILTIFSYLYDLNYDISFRIIKENNYLKKFYNNLKYKDIFKEYLEYLEKYIEERVD